MISIVDDFLQNQILLNKLKALCEKHHEWLRESPHHSENHVVNWFPNKINAIGCSFHREEEQNSFFNYYSCLKKIVNQFVRKYEGVEWWANCNNKLSWHIDKDENLLATKKIIKTPLLSTVFYPFASCYGGELLVGDSSLELSAIEELNSGLVDVAYSPKYINSIIRIPPRVNRLVLFTPGIIHSINDFTGSRYSVAVNIWGQRVE